MKRVPDRKYTAEFREAAVRQALESGLSLMQVARTLEMSDKTLWRWVEQARQGKVVKPARRAVSDVEAENAKLRQENERLKLEKEILKKAAAYFAKESR
jgi:transposase